jgi:hypothetical protein
LLRVLLLQLHRGEAEAIALATDLKADIVLIDEQEGRQLASKTGLAVTGILGILLRAKIVLNPFPTNSWTNATSGPSGGSGGTAAAARIPGSGVKEGTSPKRKPAGSEMDELG